MPNPEEIDGIYQALRRLAAENPRKARQRFEELLHGNAGVREAVLLRMAAPGEGRLRQLVANAMRTSSERLSLAEHFTRWLAVETDEFAHRAISAALEVGSTSAKRAVTAQTLVEPSLVELFRYVADRMSHELRNALLAPKTRLLQLRDYTERIGDSVVRSDLVALLAQLDDDFHGLFGGHVRQAIAPIALAQGGQRHHVAQDPLQGLLNLPRMFQPWHRDIVGQVLLP
jgi:hypothetical protein